MTEISKRLLSPASQTKEKGRIKKRERGRRGEREEGVGEREVEERREGGGREGGGREEGEGRGRGKMSDPTL